MGNKEGSGTPEWLDKLDKDKEQKEKVVQHTPKRQRESRKKKRWAYTLTEGGKKHFVDLPVTEEQIEKVKNQLTHPHNWRRYHKNPYGGDVNYTQINCFPPFDYIRVAEVFLPNGEVWSSRTKKFHKASEYAKNT